MKRVSADDGRGRFRAEDANGLVFETVYLSRDAPEVPFGDLTVSQLEPRSPKWADAKPAKE